MDESTNGRIAAARGRAAGAKRLLATSAAALFAVVLVGVRVSHPGQAPAAGSGGSTATDQTSNGDQVQNFDFGQSDIGPSAGGSSGPTVDTHAS
jgi:hypothetical protein